MDEDELISALPNRHKISADLAIYKALLPGSIARITLPFRND